MTDMSPPSVALLRAAVDDPDTIRRYLSHVVAAPDGVRCRWWWSGAISGKGHGRFWLGTTGGRDVAVIAHRFAWALRYGVDALLSVEVLSHCCDNPLCQTVEDLTPSTNAHNRAEWAQRRHSPGNALRDRRGARRRARELRDAVRNNAADPAAVSRAGLGSDLDQDTLW